VRVPFLVHECSLQRHAARENMVQSLWMEVSLLEFVLKLPFGLFFGVIGDHGWRYTIALEDKGQGLMSIPFALHGVSTCPTKRHSLSLGHFVALS
jgi:hypothetical protein